MGNQSTKAGVVVWGQQVENSSGEEKVYGPRLVEALRHVHVRAVVCGGHHSCVLTEGNEVYTWGSNKSGQLGLGPDWQEVPLPRTIRSLNSKNIRQISCAEHHTAAVSESGVLYTWGRGQNGRLGHGCKSNEMLPKPVETLFGQHVAQVSCGDFHTACVCVTGGGAGAGGVSSSTAGSTTGGGPGAGADSGGNLASHLAHHATSHGGGSIMSAGGGANDRISGASGTGTGVQGAGGSGNHHALAGAGVQHHHPHHFSTSQHHGAAPAHSSSCAIVYTWGLGLSGRLGHGDEADRAVPMPLKDLGEGVITCGGHHTAFLATAQGCLYTWGGGAFGKLGHGNKESCLSPVLLQAPVGRKMKQCALGSQHSMSLTTAGEVFTWGQAGRLGHALSEMDEVTPRLVQALNAVFVLQISTGHSHCAAVTDRGDVWAWGTSRVFGHTEATIPANVPTQIRVLSGKAVVGVSCGFSHTVALSDQKLFAERSAALLQLQHQAGGAGPGAAAAAGATSSTGDHLHAVTSSAHQPQHGTKHQHLSERTPSHATVSSSTSSAGAGPTAAGVGGNNAHQTSSNAAIKRSGSSGATTGGGGTGAHEQDQSSTSTQRSAITAALEHQQASRANVGIPSGGASAGTNTDGRSGTSAGTTNGINPGVASTPTHLPGGDPSKRQNCGTTTSTSRLPPKPPIIELNPTFPDTTSADVRQLVFVSSELKSYQNLALRLTRQLQDAYAKIFDLQSENSFLKSELEVMHHNARQD
ncbi:unnamed protein product [Amoebophrya sp. A120]|nr:unnamed protein product [Amoebophrya sp. A120]|eukprot:GSA120T00020080001.1